MLAVLDLDVGRRTLTIGLIAEYGVEPLIHIRIPVEAFFNLKQASNWHIYLGTAEEPIQAKIISTFDGSGYLMLNGEGLTLEGFYEVTGFAIGMGLQVELIWGNKEVRIYASVAGGFDALVGFDPFSLQGQFSLRGQLRFLIFSVAAWAGLDITIRNEPETGERTTRIGGEICGEIKITRRRKLKACLDFELGPDDIEPIAPPLVEKMAIVSRGPALVLGSGASQPIDAVLAQGIVAETEPSAADFDAVEHPRVPIDSILAFGLAAPAHSEGEESILGTTISDSPGPGGWIDQGEGEAALRDHRRTFDSGRSERR